MIEAAVDIDTLLIDLNEVPLGEVLSRQDSALGLAVRRVLRSGSEDDDDQAMVAAFSNFV